MIRRKLAPLKDLAEVNAGYSARPFERHEQGQYRLLTGKNIRGLNLEFLEQDFFVAESGKHSFQRSIVHEGDILISILFEERKLYIYKPHDPPAVASNNLALIRPHKDSFLRDYLNTSVGREQFLQAAARKTGGGFVARIKIKDLRDIRVPLLDPGEIQGLAEGQLSLIGNELLTIIQRGESTQQEFKSTLRRNLHSKQNDERIEDAVLKTIGAFCNTEGGILLIGIEDSGNILGIEADGFTTTDSFSLHLGNLIERRLQPSPREYVKFRVVTYSGRSICIVNCERAEREIWFNPKGKSLPPELYIRVGPSSRPLQGPEITNYCRKHFPSQ